MAQDLDINGKRLINLPAPLSTTEALRKGDIVTDATGATVQYVDDSVAGTIRPHTLSEAKVLATAIVGQVVQITDRADAQFEYVLASAVTPNTSNIIQCSAPIATLALDLKITANMDLRAFGVVGDGVTDNYVFLQTAVDAVHGAESASLVLPYGQIGFTQTLLIPQQVNFQGQTCGNGTAAAGFDGSVLKPLAGFTGNTALKYEDITTYMTGVETGNFKLDMQNADIHGIEIYRPYDSFAMKNVNIIYVASDKNALRVLSADGTGTGGVGQTATFENIVGIHRAGETATVPTFRIENLQEAVFTSCKAFGGFQSDPSTSDAWQLIGCRGVVLNGCSSAFADTGIRLISNVRNTEGVTIIGHTYETTVDPIETQASGGFSIKFIENINPRHEGTIAGGYKLNGCELSKFDVSTRLADIDATANQLTVYAQSQANITDLGSNNTIIAHPNAIDDYYSIAARLGVVSANTPAIALVTKGRTGDHRIAWSATDVVDNGVIFVDPLGVTYLKVRPTSNYLELIGDGQSLVLTSPDGLTTMRMRLSDAGALEVVAL